MRSERSREEDLILEFVEKPELIQEVESRLEQDGRLGINIGIQEGLLLKSLCAQPHIQKVVEIGTQYGCSAAWMAMALGKGNQIFTLEKDPQCLTNSQITFDDPRFKAYGVAVEQLAGDALKNLETLTAKGPFDLVFIDANKAAYFDYLVWARDNLNPGGLIVLDNVFLFGSVFQSECPEKTPKKMWTVMRRVLESQLQHPDYHSSIVPTAEGLLISCKKQDGKDMSRLKNMW